MFVYLFHTVISLYQVLRTVCSDLRRGYSNFEVIICATSFSYLSMFLLTVVSILISYFIFCMQVALTEAKDHVSEMNDGKEVNIYF
jgi:hypothetical protein